MFANGAELQLRNRSPTRQADTAMPKHAAEWPRLVIPSTGTNVEMPVSTSTEETELPDGGIGRA
jgi:hypothetical protein